MAKKSSLMIRVEVFNFVVNYSRSFKDAIAAGCYDLVNEDITEVNFPPDNDEQGKKEVVFKLFHFDRYIESREVIQKIEDGRCRPATIRELLALGVFNPELQRQFPIIALGSVLTDCYGIRNVAELWSHFNRRELRSVWFDGGWSDYCRFLAVSK